MALSGTRGLTRNIIILFIINIPHQLAVHYSYDAKGGRTMPRGKDDAERGVTMPRGE